MMSDPLPPDGSPPQGLPQFPAAMPADDAAARFRRSSELPPPESPRPAPQPVAEPAPPAAAAAAPSGPPPVFSELLERSLSALFLGRSGYAPLAERPAPSYGTMTLLALTFAVAGLGLNVVLTAVSQPAQLGRFPAWFYAAVAAAAVGLCLGGLLLGAALLTGLGRVLGGGGGFERGYLAAAMLFALAPVQSLASLFPYAWLAPSLLFAWAGAGALSGLLRANFPGALTATVMLAGLSIASQGVARAAIAKSQEMLAQSQALMQTGQAATNAAALMQTVQSMQIQSGGAPAPLVGDLADGGEGAAPAPPSSSGLDLLRGPGEAPPATGAAPTPEQQRRMLEQNGALRAQVVGMLESVLPMMDNPALVKGLDAQGKQDVAELKTLLSQLKNQAATDRKISDEEFAASMQKVQGLTMRLMAAGIGATDDAPAPPKPKRIK